MNPPPLDYRAPTLGRPIFSIRAMICMLILGAVVTATMIFVILALFAPMVSLVQSVSSPKP